MNKGTVLNEKRFKGKAIHMVVDIFNLRTV